MCSDISNVVVTTVNTITILTKTTNATGNYTIHNIYCSFDYLIDNFVIFVCLISYY